MSNSQKNKNCVAKWSPEMAYVVGLITTDGCLSKDGRHIDFTSKDIQLLNTFKRCVGLDVKITYKTGGYSGKQYPRIQFSNVKLYQFLIKIGLTPNKTKTIKALKIPKKHFFDFLRGHFDGDGSSYKYWDKRWPNSFMFYTYFCSASLIHLKWLQQNIIGMSGIKGAIQYNRSCWQLQYAKQASQALWHKMYYKKDVPCLVRKRKRIEQILQEQAEVEKLVNSPA